MTAKKKVIDGLEYEVVDTRSATPAAPADEQGVQDTFSCEPWCAARHASDPACWGDNGWGGVGGHSVRLTTEAWDSAEHNSITPYAYRGSPAHRPVVKLHCYRPSDRDYLDAEVHLTADEARELAAHLIAVADLIGGTG